MVLGILISAGINVQIIYKKKLAPYTLHEIRLLVLALCPPLIKECHKA